MRKMKNSKGFTLMEMLIVVAIIAVLVAVMIPVMTNQLERSREAADAANIRAAYAEVMAAALTGDTTNTNVTLADHVYTATVEATQKQADWQNTSIEKIAGFDVANTGAGTIQAVVKGASWTISYNETTGAVTITPVN